MATISSLLDLQHKQLQIFFDSLDTQKVELLVSLILDVTDKNKGNVIFCGIGKSGHMAKHIASLLTSIGIPALTICPIDGLHGDIGIAHSNDLVIYLSKSGNTEELLRFAPFIQKRSIHTLGIFCNQDTKLSQYCDDLLILPCGEELDQGFDLVPTTSILSFIILGNLLVSTLICRKQLSLDQYSMNHPAGSIGRKLLLSVSDLLVKMESNYANVFSETKIIDCLIEMSGKKVGCAVVTNSKHELIGIVSDGDIRRYMVKKERDRERLDDNINKSLDARVDQIMTHNPIYIFNHQNAYQVYQQIKNKNITAIPVVNQNTKQVMGVISMRDILHAF